MSSGDITSITIVAQNAELGHPLMYLEALPKNSFKAWLADLTMATLNFLGCSYKEDVHTPPRRETPQWESLAICLHSRSRFQTVRTAVRTRPAKHHTRNTGCWAIRSRSSTYLSHLRSVWGCYQTVGVWKPGTSALLHNPGQVGSVSVWQGMEATGLWIVITAVPTRLQHSEFFFLLRSLPSLLMLYQSPGWQRCC